MQTQNSKHWLVSPEHTTLRKLTVETFHVSSRFSEADLLIRKPELYIGFICVDHIYLAIYPFLLYFPTYWNITFKVFHNNSSDSVMPYYNIFLFFC